MWEYSDTEYIKLYRRMLNWEWYTDTNTKVLFLHCLLKANWKAGKWHGYSYQRGQFITSLRSLAKETGLTVKEVRTALNHLISTNELASKPTNKFRIITVVSFDRYQSTGNQTGTQGASNGQTKGNRYKNNKKYKEGEEKAPLTDEEIIKMLKEREANYKNNDS